jgi:formylglycine-generating enzyme required for sulfatase activity
VRKAGMTVWALGVAVLGMTGSLYALDVADVVREWTPEGKKLAMERAKLPAHDEMIRIPAGEFLMGAIEKSTRILTWPNFLSGRSISMPMRSTSMKSPRCSS